MEATYTGRREIHRDGKDHFAEVVVRTRPGASPTEVGLLPATLDRLREVFGEDFEHHRHCVWSAVIVQIDTADVAGQMPHVGKTAFHAEVVDVRVSGNGGRDLSGFLLSVAGMDAIGAYLHDWEEKQARPQDAD